MTYQPADCAALAREDYLNALPRPLAQVEDRYQAAPNLPNDGLGTLSMRVESFSRPVPASMLTAASQIFPSTRSQPWPAAEMVRDKRTVPDSPDPANGPVMSYNGPPDTSQD